MHGSTPGQPVPFDSRQQTNYSSPNISATSAQEHQGEKIYKPEVAHNYVPHQRLLDTVAGYQMDKLLQVGEQLEQAKPLFLFAPELGSVDLHALTMSLSSGILSEINTALDVLLVVSADHSLLLNLSECPDLLDALSDVGLDVLNEVILGKKPSKVQPMNYDDTTLYHSNDVIEEIFSKYSGEKNNDVQIVVDSFTSEPIEEKKSHLSF